MPAEFLCNLPKNLTTHLTHKLYAVLPLQHTFIIAVRNNDVNAQMIQFYVQGIQQIPWKTEQGPCCKKYSPVLVLWDYM